MSSYEFSEWLAFNRIEPGEPIRTDLRFAKMTRDIVTALTALFSKSRRPTSLKDFKLDVDKWDTHSQAEVRDARKRIKNSMYHFAKMHSHRLRKQKDAQ